MSRKIKHLIVDANNLFYRGYYTGRMVDQKGRNVAGIFNFMKMLNVLLHKFEPGYCVLCWDLGKSRARFAIYPEYKAGRRSSMTKEQLENISWQIASIKQILNYLPVRQLQVMDVEADDIIGYMCQKLKGSKLVVSNDRDLFQLISDDTSIYLPKGAVILNKKNIKDHLGIPLSRYLLFKAIVGDNSDNIKGVRGIGEKTAIKILSPKVPDIKPEWADIIKRNTQLMDIGVLLNKAEIKEIRKVYKSQQSKEIDPLIPRRMFTNLRFRSIVSRYNQWVKPFRTLG